MLAPCSTAHRCAGPGRSWRFGQVSLLACLLWVSGGKLVADEPAATTMAGLAALDLAGQPHLLTGQTETALAIVFLAGDCQMSRDSVGELNRLAKAVADKQIRLYGVLSDARLSRAGAVAIALRLGCEFPVLFDAAGELAAALRPTHTPEAFVLDRDDRLVYRGRIDDRFTPEGQVRGEASTHELADALAAAAAGETVAVASTTAVGSARTPDREYQPTTEVTYNRQIAPLLATHCHECHRPGEVAPFSLLGYDDAAKRGEFLAQVCHERRMPPWKATVGQVRFQGERRLTDAQIALIERWVAQGAPQGNADDLPPPRQFASGWRLGEPDQVIVATEPFTVPASGADVFQHFVIPLDLPENKNVVAIEFRPGNPAVVHHALVFVDASGVGRQKDAATPEPGYQTSGSIDIPIAGMLGVWTPGMTPRYFPPGIGVPVRPGMDLVLQLHLHPSGREEVDQSSIAIYYADADSGPMKPTSMLVLGTLLIDVPAGESTHAVRSSITLPIDVTLLSLLPHMHLIGKEMEIVATLPDGQQQSLLRIDDWDFFWQDNYVYHRPLTLPAGTRIDVRSQYDNSADNPRNPTQPPARVLFGNDSTDEMCFALFQTVAAEPAQERRLQMALMQSFLKDWTSAKLDSTARATIAEEAAKLFGTGQGSGLTELLQGGRSRRAEGASPQGK